MPPRAPQPRLDLVWGPRGCRGLDPRVTPAWVLTPDSIPKITYVNVNLPRADIPQAAATRTSNLTDDVNIDHIGPLLPPAILLEEIPASETLVEDIAHRRKEVSVQLSTALGEI